jgi:hypothetical protein
MYYWKVGDFVAVQTYLPLKHRAFEFLMIFIDFLG